MIRDMRKRTVTMEQMERIIGALEDLRHNLLPTEPALFATMAEAPLEALSRLCADVSNDVREMTTNK